MTLLLVRVIYRSRIRASRTRPQFAQDGGLLRLVELQVSPVERIQFLLAQSRPHQPVGPMTSADQQVAQLVRHRITHQLVGARDGIQKRQLAQETAALVVW